ncbi:hypothetical protein SELMODRAFT_404392 [Selaginella moellendorffii]|uniref:Uncharacterized protein n=1 Tax=Selaginella moellendorffii TaxID=88036 RepID=D8QV68_SELML|nr:hypothetical protein SELMODRAFT_404392 [Selaginella moellendorffii]
MASVGEGRSLNTGERQWVRLRETWWANESTPRVPALLRWTKQEGSRAAMCGEGVSAGSTARGDRTRLQPPDRCIGVCGRDWLPAQHPTSGSSIGLFPVDPPQQPALPGARPVQASSGRRSSHHSKGSGWMGGKGRDGGWGGGSRRSANPEAD